MGFVFVSWLSYSKTCASSLHEIIKNRIDAYK